MPSLNGNKTPAVRNVREVMASVVGVTRTAGDTLERKVPASEMEANEATVGHVN
jgi:hypothetical protein